MISVKRNKKGEPVKAPGVRVRSSSIYHPNQADVFKVSRGKFTDFLTCQRCFYLDRVKGLISPSTPGWTLNETTDLLLKKEFDLCRDQQIPHRTFEQFGLVNVVPYQHESIDIWRDSLHGGLQHHIEGTNVIISGGIDDIWHDLSTNELIVVDYKSQASVREVTPQSYLAGVFHQGYKIQLEIYAYILSKMGFRVSSIGYFYVCNGDRTAEAFNGRIVFGETLVPYSLNTTWIENKLLQMIDVMNSETLPSRNFSCENCAYSQQRVSMESLWSYDS